MLESAEVLRAPAMGGYNADAKLGACVLSEAGDGRRRAACPRPWRRISPFVKCVACVPPASAHRPSAPLARGARGGAGRRSRRALGRLWRACRDRHRFHMPHDLSFGRGRPGQGRWLRWGVGARARGGCGVVGYCDPLPWPHDRRHTPIWLTCCFYANALTEHGAPPRSELPVRCLILTA